MTHDDLTDKNKVDKIYNVYYAKTATWCKLVYYDYEDGKIKKRLRQINFTPRELDPIKCVLKFMKIANSFNEPIPKDDSPVFHNGIYTYFKGKYNGYIEVYDMNSAYLWALTQPLADVTTKTECSIKDVIQKKYDYYSFENPLHRIMYYKEQVDDIQGAFFWDELKIYGYKSKVFFEKTAQKLYELKKKNKQLYKNVANITVGCMHKRSGKRNSATLAASLYAYFEWYVGNLVYKLKKNKYNVIMVTTDSVKIAGHYDESSNILKIGDGLGEFKLEYKGESNYLSQGHYEEGSIKWKGMPEYLRGGGRPCKFIEELEEERGINEKFAKL